MKFDRTFLIERVLRRPAVGVVAGITVFAAVMSGTVHADPSEDGVAKLNELSRQAEQLTEAMHTAQLDLDNKLQAQAAAEKKHSDDLARADAAKGQLATYQGAVDKFAAAVYMGGRTDGLNAILTAESPQGLIDKMAVQKVMATEMSAQMQNYRRVNEEAVRAEADSAKSAADAKTAAEQAAAVRADLQRKQSQLQVQIAIVKSRYATLTPDQRTALAAPGPVPPVQILAAPAPDALPESLVAGVRLRGKVDRIDYSADGSEAWVLDYKTGSSSKYAGLKPGNDPLAGGTLLQLAAYARAADAPRVYAAYWFVTRRGKFEMIPGRRVEPPREAALGEVAPVLAHEAVAGGVEGGAQVLVGLHPATEFSLREGHAHEAPRLGMLCVCATKEFERLRGAALVAQRETTAMERLNVLVGLRRSSGLPGAERNRQNERDVA